MKVDWSGGVFKADLSIWPKGGWGLSGGHTVTGGEKGNQFRME